MAAARVFGPNKIPGGLTHVVILVHGCNADRFVQTDSFTTPPPGPSDSLYLFDTAFGSQNPFRPLRMEDSSAIEQGRSISLHRLVRQLHPSSHFPSFTFEESDSVQKEIVSAQKLWVLQHKKRPTDEEWSNMYAFSPTETFEEDIKVSLRLLDCVLLLPNSRPESFFV